MERDVWKVRRKLHDDLVFLPCGGEAARELMQGMASLADAFERRAGQFVSSINNCYLQIHQPFVLCTFIKHRESRDEGYYHLVPRCRCLALGPT